ncbi:MAG TPA: DUF3467 domain-containing protein [Anaeromyxobacteraceae bacterium]|nr:DUF3467 domain-containing protein [Anaeromyxobacteraceae bacterium]
MSDKPSQLPPNLPSSPGTVQIQIELDPAVANGAFINFAMVNHTDAEFTVDLMYLQPQAPKAVVRARCIMTPKHLKRLIAAMQDNLAKYEARFGVVDLGDAPHFPTTQVN